MLLSVDLELELSPESLRDLNAVSFQQQIDVKVALDRYIVNNTNKFIGTFNIDTEDESVRLTHINGLTIVYNDFVKTNDEYLTQVQSYEW